MHCWWSACWWFQNVFSRQLNSRCKHTEFNTRTSTVLLSRHEVLTAVFLPPEPVFLTEEIQLRLRPPPDWLSGRFLPAGHWLLRLSSVAPLWADVWGIEMRGERGWTLSLPDSRGHLGSLFYDRCIPVSSLQRCVTLAKACKVSYAYMSCLG